MKELHRNEKYMYILEQDDDDTMILTVTCGGVGMYDLRIELTPTEIKNYLDQGESYLNTLASEIGKNTSAFLDRAK
jgi:hypothetical protein